MAAVQAATVMANLEHMHSEVSCLMYRLSALDPSDLSSQDCLVHMIAASQRFAKLRATLKALVKSATFPQPRTDASAQLVDLSPDAMCHLQGSADVTVVGRLKTTARLMRDHIRQAFRSRLTDAIDKAGLTGVVRFAPQLDNDGVMTAVWLMEEGGRWDEVRKGLKGARQCGYCQLPITIEAVDLQKHDTKRAYLALPRVPAQWMIVGRHVVFRRADGQHAGTFELFYHPTTNEIRAIRDEPEFAMTLNPRLPRTFVHHLQQHPFQQHAKPDDPPVLASFKYDHEAGEWVPDLGLIDGSTSGFIITILLHFVRFTGPPPASSSAEINRSAGGGYLDKMLTGSPHTLLEGCTAAMAREREDGRHSHINHLLMSFDDPFIAWLTFKVPVNPDDLQTVRVTLATYEQSVGTPGDPWTTRYPRVISLARRPLGPVAPVLLDGQTP
ncbi:unnamed protein product [Vitrella brassicaformis CCMP3155]|uniref:Uncharacterized protein n=2 Tax=Vitrella brassicaformis TaxID=1169539 RepID=A0A0G4GX31_VITBC|nr:unnamed protein product [Vitrella brassicaformis CCMP3155]|eukprot:CEM35606.1 unnamed protein product [Vitrella brassicaformis CCMP3155]